MVRLDQVPWSHGGSVRSGFELLSEGWRRERGSGGQDGAGVWMVMPEVGLGGRRQHSSASVSNSHSSAVPSPTHHLVLPVHSRRGIELLALAGCHRLLCLATSGGSFSSAPCHTMPRRAEPPYSTSDRTMPWWALPHLLVQVHVLLCHTVPHHSTLQGPTTLPCIPPCHTVPLQPQPRQLWSLATLWVCTLLMGAAP